MSTQSHDMCGYYPYKMDTKCRVSIPSDWRPEVSNSVLRLMVSSNNGVPTLRILTQNEFEKIKNDVNASDMLHSEKRAVLSVFYERCTNTHINEQGKLSIPKALLEHPGLVPGEVVVLCGRGDYIEILNEENHKKVRKAEEASEVIERANKQFGLF